MDGDVWFYLVMAWHGWVQGGSRAMGLGSLMCILLCSAPYQTGRCKTWLLLSYG